MDIDREEMEYVDGGFYISNSALKSVVAACAFNPIPAVIIAIGYAKASALIVAAATSIGARLGSLGGPIGTAVGGIIAGALGLGASGTIVHALVQGKGINIGLSYTSFGVPYWVDISVQ